MMPRARPATSTTGHVPHVGSIRSSRDKEESPFDPIQWAKEITGQPTAIRNVPMEEAMTASRISPSVPFNIRAGWSAKTNGTT